LGAAFASHAVLRTRFFDDFLLTAVGAGCRQVILLAAGLDSRPFRLPWPAGTRLYELDLPGVINFKEEVLAHSGARPACDRAVIPADLRGSWPERLTATGFDPAVPTAWLPEGLLLYLTAGEAARLLTDVGTLSAPGSRLSFEQAAAVGDSPLARAAGLPGMSQYTALWKGGLGPGAADWLASHGWDPAFRDGAEFAAACGRPESGSGAAGFLTAVRRA
ncbi:MAG: SAM-dependent methyltransferase, partial [Streptosporangiales bacterium]|nr:SAM-dependent methyltransferase [Streptosporangiales bacterium]